MKKIRVLFIIPSLFQGGTNRVLEDLTTLIDKSKYDSFVMPLRKGMGINSYYGRQFSKGSHLIFLPALLGWMTFGRIPFALHNRIYKCLGFDTIRQWLFKKLAKNIEKRIQPDVVVAFEEGLPVAVCHFFKCKKIAWIHCDYQQGYAKNMDSSQLKIEEKKFSLYHKIVCVSYYTANTFTSIFKRLKDKTIVIHNPVGVERILKMADEKTGDERFVKEGFIIISVGRFAKVKQFDLIPDIIRNVERINNQQFKYRWYIIGDGEKKLIDETMQKIDNYGLGEKLVLLGAKDNPYPFLKAADLYVCTSSTEAYPCVINEAKVLQVPIVSNMFPSVCEIMTSDDGVVSEFSTLPSAVMEIMANISKEKPKTRSRMASENDIIMKEIEKLFKIEIEEKLKTVEC